MRLLGIAIEDFRSIHHQRLPADGLVVLFGPNSAGKTSVLEAAIELLRAASNPRIDPGAVEDVAALGSVRFTLPDARISGSPDAVLYQALLNGDLTGGQAWEELAPDAASILRGMNVHDASEWITCRLVEAGQDGSRSDREILARGVLDQASAFFIADFEDVSMHTAISRLPDDVVEAARRIAAVEGSGDPLHGIAVSLIAGQAATIGSVADPDKLTHVFPPVIVLDGDTESLAAELRKALPEIHDRLWNLHHPREPGGFQWVDEFEIGTWLSDERYRTDTWLEQLSGSGQPEIPGPFDAYGQSTDWFRVRHSILAVAAMLEKEANRIAPGFLRTQGQIGIEILPVSVWGPEDRRVRVTFTGRDGERRDLQVVGAGTGRWAAAAVQLACRRLVKGRQAVSGPDGSPVDDPEASREIVRAARERPLEQVALRLEPADAPGVYIVDEPEAHLHPAAITSVRAWLEELASTAATVLAATHSPMLLGTGSDRVTRVLVLLKDGNTELRPLTGKINGDLTEAAEELGMTKGDLLLMTRLAVFAEGPHDAIILNEMFGETLRYAGIRIFPAHGGDNFQELVTTRPGLVGSEIIMALGIRIAIISDTSPTRVEPAVRRLLREANLAGVEVTAVELSEEDILFYLDAQICRNYAPDFPGWRAARDAARSAERHDRSARNWKKWVSEEYGLDLSRDNIRRIAAECGRQGHIPHELIQKIQQLTALAADSS
jgi:hypothetical protein